jgi:hypothetical protein
MCKGDEEDLESEVKSVDTVATKHAKKDISTEE